ncbi:MAG: transcriptional repressor [Phycisphaerae bacterium]|jgi:Fur family ferric uptake transcriptional regulator
MSKKTRNTRQKEIIEKELSKIDVFFSAENLYNQIRFIDKEIGLATVYRFLNEMRKKGIIYSYLCDRRMVYSRERKGHCHFTCEKTGKVVHFDVDSLDFLKNKIPGSITSFQLEVKGICKDKCRECLAKKK